MHADDMMNERSQLVPNLPPPPSTKPSLDELLDVKHAARVLGISVKTLRDHVLHRRIDYVKLRGRVLFRPDSLCELIERSTVRARVQ
jgi:hypothetical protein